MNTKQLLATFCMFGTLPAGMAHAQEVVVPTDYKFTLGGGLSGIAISSADDVYYRGVGWSPNLWAGYGPTHGVGLKAILGLPMDTGLEPLYWFTSSIYATRSVELSSGVDFHGGIGPIFTPYPSGVGALLAISWAAQSEGQRSPVSVQASVRPAAQVIVQSDEDFVELGFSAIIEGGVELLYHF